MDTAAKRKEADPDLSFLCGLTSFVTNSQELVTIARALTPAQVSVLCSLCISGSEIEHLIIQNVLPIGTGNQLGLAISAAAATASTPIRTLTLGKVCTFKCEPAPELFQVLVAASASANSAAITTLEQLIVSDVCIDDWCDSFGKFTALRSFTVRGDEKFSRSTPSLIASIGRLRELESLEIEGIKLANSEAEILAETLKALPLLANLSIRLAELRAGRSIGSLVALGQIQKLDLWRNRMGDREISAMLNVILYSKLNNSKLQELIL